MGYSLAEDPITCPSKQYPFSCPFIADSRVQGARVQACHDLHTNIWYMKGMCSGCTYYMPAFLTPYVHCKNC